MNIKIIHSELVSRSHKRIMTEAMLFVCLVSNCVLLSLLKKKKNKKNERVPQFSCYDPELACKIRLTTAISMGY